MNKYNIDLISADNILMVSSLASLYLTRILESRAS